MRHLPHNYHTYEYGTTPPPPDWMLFPARTVMPFLRSPLGYETVHPRPGFFRALKVVILPVLVFWAGRSLAHVVWPANLGHIWMMRFAAAGFALSAVHFLWRAFGPSRGEEVHSAEAGYSWVTWYTDLPMLLCEMVIVPCLLAAGGYVLSKTASFELGWWLILSAASYLVMAFWEFSRRTAQKRATIDDKIRAQSFDEQLGAQDRARRIPFWRRWFGRAHHAPGAADVAELGGNVIPMPRANASRDEVIAYYVESVKASFPWSKYKN